MSAIGGAGPFEPIMHLSDPISTGPFKEVEESSVIAQALAHGDFSAHTPMMAGRAAL